MQHGMAIAAFIYCNVIQLRLTQNVKVFTFHELPFCFRESHYTDFCNILFYQGAAVYLYYLTQPVNLACQKKQEYPEKSSMSGKSLTHKYSFHKNMLWFFPSKLQGKI